MKTRTAMIGMIAVMVVAGCTQKPDPRDAKIAKLEARIGRLETNLVEFEGIMENGIHELGDLSTKQGELITNLQAVVLTTAESGQQMQSELQEFIFAFTNRPASAGVRYASAAPAQRAGKGGALKDGIPAAVYERIAADAASKWGSDFEMQAYTIKNQVEAYRKLHP